MEMRQFLSMDPMPMSTSLQSKLWVIVLLMSTASVVEMETCMHQKRENSAPFPPIAAGLEYGFYCKSCPDAEGMVFEKMRAFLSSNISQAAGVVRLLFHDCFVQGCDASVLVGDAAGEQFSLPNLSLRRSALEVVGTIKASLESSCPGIVSCADVLALAARDAVLLAGGPFIPMPTGRRDSLTFADNATVISNLPPPFFNSSQLLAAFSSKALNATDLAALSGSHTIGIAHCNSFNDRLQPTPDPRLDSSFAKFLLQNCPNSSVNAPVDLDNLTPCTFDNLYFKNIQDGKVLLDSDATLFGDSTLKNYVNTFASNQTEFFIQYSISLVKMSMIQVLTGSDGNIRKNCSTILKLPENISTRPRIEQLEAGMVDSI